tara:strand:+ start:707 stop:889 length:183 start_codon:yes stop_codon:yes gene_type:complete
MATIVTNQKKSIFNVKESVSKIGKLLALKGQFIEVSLLGLNNKTSLIILKKSTIQRVVTK